MSAREVIQTVAKYVITSFFPHQGGRLAAVTLHRDLDFPPRVACLTTSPHAGEDFREAPREKGPVLSPPAAHRDDEHRGRPVFARHRRRAPLVIASAMWEQFV